MIVTNYQIESTFKTTIVHISDLHFSKNFKTEKFKEIIKSIIELKPVYVIITGDIINEVDIAKTKKIEKLYNFLKKLATFSKVIISLGNHDIRDSKKMKFFPWYLELKKINNLIILDNEEFVDNEITFYGMTMSQKYYKKEKNLKEQLYESLETISITNSKFNILLFHSPYHLNKKEFANVLSKFDLVLCGHMHNGLVPHFIKGNFAFITPTKELFVKNARGSFYSDKTQIIISGGISKLLKYPFLNKFYKSDLNYIKINKLEQKNCKSKEF